MTDGVDGPMTFRSDATGRPPHAGHDPLLIGRLAGDDVTVTERQAAERLVAACEGCGQLLGDLVALRRSLRAELSVPVRPRDFRLTPHAAAEARRPRLHRWLDRLPRAALLQPLAGAAVMLGLVLLVGGSLGSSGTLGQALDAVGSRAGGTEAANLPAASGAVPADAKGGQPAASSQPAAPGGNVPVPTAAPTGAGGPAPAPTPAAGSGAQPWLLPGGALLVVLGSGTLIALRRRRPPAS